MEGTMKVKNSEHTSRPWRIRELLPDFRLEDVWELDAPGHPGDFDRAIELITSTDPGESGPLPVRALFGLRWKLGEILGWDDDATGIDGRVPSLRDRLPADLIESPGPEFTALPFKTLYRTHDEFAAEVANGTMHGVLHLGNIDDDERPRGQMAVYVKPNGLFGQAYMAAIKPFRLFVVYPPLLRQFEQAWRGRAKTPAGV
jgi:hypothetical protein